MNVLVNQKRYILITFGLLLGLVLNIFLFQTPLLGVVLGLVYIFVYSKALGKLLFTKEQSWYQNIFGFLFLLVLLVILGTAVYYAHSLSVLLILAILVLVPWLIFILRTCGVCNDLGTKLNLGIVDSSLKSRAILMLYFLLWLIGLVALFISQTTSAIRTPWEVVPKLFFVVYFVSSLALVKILLDEKYLKTKKILLLSLHFVLSLGVALVVYKIGYGFDGFVHRATEEVIYNKGLITPKPFYYIGQYSLVVILSKLFFVGVALVDKILVPILASIFLPILSYFSLKNVLKNDNYLFLSIVFLLLVGDFFFYSVPQSLANLFLLLLIILSVPYLTNKSFAPGYLWLIGVCVLLIHPISGIPAVIFLSFICLAPNKNILSKKYGFWFWNIFGILAGVSLPVFFWLGSKVSSQFSVKFSTRNLIYLKETFVDFFNYLPFHSTYHLVYFYKLNETFLFLVLIFFGVYYLSKHKHGGLAWTYLIMAGILFVNLFLLGFVEFSGLINYEQGEFMRRVGQLMVLFLTPLFLSGIYFVVTKISTLPTWNIFKLQINGQIVTILTVTTLLTMGLYLNYPRVDAFEKMRGYSVSEWDINAVKWIENDAENHDYLVLANQSTSAAALQEFGFKKYYSMSGSEQKEENKIQNIFYYPIPTSSLLYDIYLQMVYGQPKLEYIKKAQEITGASQVYFVINDYWLDAQKRVEEAKQIASEWRDFGDGRVWVFKF